MKTKHIFSVFASWLLMLPFVALADGVVHGTVTLNDKTITAEYYIVGSNAHLGSGNNACIPQYSEGKVTVLATITVGSTTYPVTEVSALAFRMCSKITEVVLPVNVTRIGDFAFKSCFALTKVSLPSTLTSIGTGAFIDLPDLARIDCHATTPPTWEYNDVFKFHTGGISDQTTYTYNNILLCVPEGSISAYKAAEYSNISIGWTKAEGWKNFGFISYTYDENAVAYAEYDNGTLTFYYDAYKEILNT